MRACAPSLTSIDGGSASACAKLHLSPWWHRPTWKWRHGRVRYGLDGDTAELGELAGPLVPLS